MGDFDKARPINPGFGKPSFSRIEIRDILISIAVLTLAFTVMLARSNPRYFSTDAVENALSWLAISFILVITSFILHEMGHKFVAQHFGAWSEYRMYPLGLLLCIVSSLIGILFAAPGAVYINGRINDEMNGKISIAGPAVNLVLGFVALALSLILDGRMGAIMHLMAHLNGFLAAFNLIPLFPLDGSKVLRWNPVIYVIALALAIALVIVTW